MPRDGTLDVLLLLNRLAGHDVRRVNAHDCVVYGLDYGLVVPEGLVPVDERIIELPLVLEEVVGPTEVRGADSDSALRSCGRACKVSGLDGEG